MGVFSFLQPPKKGAPATQIAALEESLAKLRGEHKSVQAIVESHGQKRAEMLLSDAADADIVRLDADADLARIRLERLELAELELVERIERARDKSERERLASEYERAAAQIEEKAKAIEGPIAQLAAAFAALAEVIPAETGISKVFEGHLMPQPAKPEDVAQAILGNALYAAAPRLFEATTLVRRGMNEQALASVESVIRLYALDNFKISSSGKRPGADHAMLPAAEAAQRLIVGPQREKARTLRHGDAEHLMAAE
ncbi:hypothetical protein HUN39_18860 [Methylocystis sp. FS]|uniref:hypothetical protein n=1 Tax=Methylocystis silviterrae TaxID=2743612 RepID=UPI001582C5A7|nr:hypothetical protein [Methylocystis silviterrae]NUJ82044.1 hypothetical protein [Methylocystis silviterrae]